jgi:hypothetical protein
MSVDGRQLFDGGHRKAGLERLRLPADRRTSSAGDRSFPVTGVYPPSSCRIVIGDPKVTPEFVQITER